MTPGDLTDADQNWRFPGCPEPPDWHLDWASLVERFPWLAALADCQQDPQWHAEGNVLIHVGMVIQELIALQRWRALPPVERHALFAAALLHDVGKPSTTEESAGHIRSPAHAIRGTRMARTILATDPSFGQSTQQPAIPFSVRELIVGLVWHHGLPGNFLARRNPERAVISASMNSRLDLLPILAIADARGRISQQPSDQLDRIALFEEFCLECQCLDGPREFASDHSRFVYFRTPDAHPTLQVYDSSRFEVVVLSGLPGTGKDHWAREHANGRPIVSLDHWRQRLQVDPGDNQGPVIAAARQQAREFLRQQHSFIWNATNVTRVVRDPLISLCADYHARLRIVYCEAPLPTIRGRNTQRGHSDEKTQVPWKVISKMVDHLDVPNLTEAHQVDYRLSGW